MIILGIDPGFSVTGYGIAQKEGQSIKILHYGFLRMSSQKHLSERVAIFHDYIADLVQKFRVSSLALETPFLGKNAQNFLKLGYLRGILYLLAHKHTLQLLEFSPREIKQAITGFGGASKEQVSRVILQLFPRMHVPDKLDVTDALAVTLCGLWRNQHQLSNNVLAR